MRRYAVYYMPGTEDPLWQIGANWLGRNPQTDEILVQPDLPNIAEVTADARMYGFHATLKPPMALNAGSSWDMLLADARALAAGLAPFDLPRLELADLQGFLALRDAEPNAALQALSDACVGGLDHLREPLGEAELERRRRARLSAVQEAMLLRWGYPYVFETWFFHMTLSRRLSAGELGLLRPAAEALFADTLRAPRRVTDICLCVQEAAGAPFTLAERLPLLGG